MNDDIVPTGVPFTWQAHQVARVLQVPARTIRYWAATGRLPAVRKGPKMWFFPADVRLLQCCYLAIQRRK